MAATTAATADTILDFSKTQGDKIELSLVDARTTAAGDQALHGFRPEPVVSTGVAGQLRYAQANGDTVVYGDTNDSDRAADFFIHLKGLVTLAATDFVPRPAPPTVAASAAQAARRIPAASH